MNLIILSLFMIVPLTSGTELFNCSGSPHEHCCSELGCVWCPPTNSCIRCATKRCLKGGTGAESFVLVKDVCPELITGNTLDCKKSEEALMNGEIILFMIFTFVLLNVLLFTYKKCSATKGVKYAHMP